MLTKTPKITPEILVPLAEPDQKALRQAQIKARQKLALFLNSLKDDHEDAFVPAVDLEQLQYRTVLNRVHSIMADSDPFDDVDLTDPYGTRDAGSPNYRNSAKNGRTMLHDAVLANNLDLVIVLVEVHKAQVDITDNDNQTPLDLALALKFHSIIQYLKSV